MQKPICAFSFNLHSWNISCNKILSEKDWKLGEKHWQQSAKDWADFSPKLSFLPTLKRRRLGGAARLFFESAWQLTSEKPNLPVVYASKNSEINRSFALWQSLLQEGDVSPTSFSLSVHNALIGQWSELCQVKSEMTAITAQKDNLEIALLEAYLLLNEGYSQVLVVVSEYPLDEKYNVATMTRLPFAYSLAMLIEKGEQFHLSLFREAKERQIEEVSDNSLFWVQQQYLCKDEWLTESHRGYWLWQRK